MRAPAGATARGKERHWKAAGWGAARAGCSRAGGCKKSPPGPEGCRSSAPAKQCGAPVGYTSRGGGGALEPAWRPAPLTLPRRPRPERPALRSLARGRLELRAGPPSVAAASSPPQPRRMRTPRWRVQRPRAQAMRQQAKREAKDGGATAS